MHAGRSHRLALALAVLGGLTSRAHADDVAAPPAFAVAGARGFGLTGPDGFRLYVHGFVATDARGFGGELPAGLAERFTLATRAAGLQLDATLYEHVAVQLLANLADRTSPVTTALVEYQASPALRLRLGRLPFPLTQERLTPPLSLPFVGPSVVGLLVPPTDTGLHLTGALGGERLRYDLALVNGAVPGVTADADGDTGKDVVARVLVRPFDGGPAPVAQLALGVGTSAGVHRGRPTAPGLSALRSYGGATFFAYRADGTPAGTAVADGALTRVAPHLLWAWGPVAVQGDAIWVRERAAGVAVDTRAADLIATVALTGERIAPLAFVAPRRPVATGGPGAILLVGGAGALRVDDAAFATAGPADPARAAAGLRVLGAGAKWYPVAGVAVFVDYGHQRFRAAPGAARRPDEHTVIARVQVIL